VWRCRMCSGQETPSRRRRMSPVLDKLLLCNFWRLGFTALSVCLLCSCPNRYCRPIQTSGCIELVMTWMLPFTCPALCYREIQIFPKNMDSLHFTLKLRPKLWTYKKLFLAEQISHGGPVCPALSIHICQAQLIAHFQHRLIVAWRKFPSPEF